MQYATPGPLRSCNSTNALPRTIHFCCKSHVIASLGQLMWRTSFTSGRRSVCSKKHQCWLRSYYSSNSSTLFRNFLPGTTGHTDRSVIFCARTNVEAQEFWSPGPNFVLAPLVLQRSIKQAATITVVSCLKIQALQLLK